MMTKTKKQKPEKIDGLSSRDLQKIRNAIRQVWHRSHARRLVVARCVGEDGFSYCEKCKERAPKVTIDHIQPVGNLLDGGIERMFCSSDKLQGLCKRCHNEKTKLENRLKGTDW